MYLSYKWLKDFVDIPKNVSTEELGTKLTVHTVEIDGVEKQADKFKNIVVGKILEIRKHPKADKLQLATVDVKKERLNIVCGAPNIQVGQLVPVALVGALMPNGLEIKKAKIRGEESSGMMCAEDELGLGEDHAGIMVLDSKAKVGIDFADFLNLDDVIFEVDNKSITNRPDLWGHFGMSREIATFLNTNLKKDLTTLSKENIEVDDEKIDLKVKIENKEKCSRYMAVAMEGIQITKSPDWLRDRLISVGQRPINNIVDITNYVMLETGQPMHAFDLTKIADKKNVEKVSIVVRTSKKEENILTLDGEERELKKDDLVISGDHDALAIAGVIGGGDSEVDDDSVSIVLEAANFDSKSIRKTSTTHGLRTEASQRFEKALDPSACEMAIVRAIELIKETVPTAKVVSKVVDETSFDYSPKEMQIDLVWLEKFLGEKIDDSTISKTLTSLGFAPNIKDTTLTLSIPSWRASKDISIREDIAEEVARIYGYDNIEAKMPKIEMQGVAEETAIGLDNKIRNILSQTPAMYEVSNYSFVGESQIKALGIDVSSYIKLANPISMNHTMLRQSMVPNMIDNVKKNQARYKDIKIFEIGQVYLPVDGEMKKHEQVTEVLPMQENRLGMLVAGADMDIFMDLKSSIAHLIEELLQKEVQFSKRENIFHWSDEVYATEIKIDDTVVGAINVVDTAILKKQGIKKQVTVAEIYMGEIKKIVSKKGDIYFIPTEKFPALLRDLSFVVDETVTYNNLRNEMKNFHELIARVDLFDVYQDEKIGKGKKSIAFNLSYQANRTLESKEVDTIQNDLIKHLEEKFEAQVRDF